MILIQMGVIMAMGWVLMAVEINDLDDAWIAWIVPIFVATYLIPSLDQCRRNSFREAGSSIQMDSWWLGMSLFTTVLLCLAFFVPLALVETPSLRVTPYLLDDLESTTKGEDLEVNWGYQGIVLHAVIQLVLVLISQGPVFQFVSRRRITRRVAFTCSVVPLGIAAIHLGILAWYLSGTTVQTTISYQISGLPGTFTHSDSVQPEITRTLVLYLVVLVLVFVSGLIRLSRRDHDFWSAGRRVVQRSREEVRFKIIPNDHPGYFGGIGGPPR